MYAIRSYYVREAAMALGTPKWKMVLSITLKASYAGVITGVLLAIARIAGETAPLLFTENDVRLLIGAHRNRNNFV